jgi:hypothetical protein
MSARKDKGKRERYVSLRYWLLDSPAWKSLPVAAHALYIQIARRYNGSNNGRIPYSMRDGVTLHISHHTVSHLLGILQDRGFIVCTRKGYFSVKTTRDASEWRLTEYDCDHPVAHATKDFMRWQLPEDADLDALNRQPSHHRKFRTRRPPRDRTEAPTRPYGGPSETVKRKNRQNGGPHETVKAKNAPSTEAPARHLQLPGRTGDDADGVATALPPAPAPASLPAPPWVPYSQRDIDHDRHSREGLMVYVADVIETQLRNLDEAKEAKQEADQPVSAPDPTPERRLSSRRVQEHARWYSDEAYWHYSPNAIAAGALDAALRANLRKEVFPEHVEIEFERVMKAVPR